MPFSNEVPSTSFRSCRSSKMRVPLPRDAGADQHPDFVGDAFDFVEHRFASEQQDLCNSVSTVPGLRPYGAKSKHSGRGGSA
jgi:hypothetical protein